MLLRLSHIRRTSQNETHSVVYIRWFIFIRKTHQSDTLASQDAILPEPPHLPSVDTDDSLGRSTTTLPDNFFLVQYNWPGPRQYVVLAQQPKVGPTTTTQAQHYVIRPMMVGLVLKPINWPNNTHQAHIFSSSKSFGPRDVIRPNSHSNPGPTWPMNSFDKGPRQNPWGPSKSTRGPQNLI
ncbi:hypothetical protein E3N88_42587 [Mikania micrantha]|uniref:Uncharacterized protein n=1 Tax=Mikania micrantha TaxID=192012 RepID=A0A5N6LHG4_9ASTR|nr:hypothetical protein E3N88_42587 [Mikania micrantha]